jgi:ribosomal protein S18 acetylase RimI-like enzyme
MLTLMRRENATLLREEIVAIVALLNAIWPNKEKTLSELAETFLERHFGYLTAYPSISRPSVRYLDWSDDQLVGHAFTFERPIASDSAEFSVMALSGVCVAPSYRRKGIGTDLARNALHRIDEGEFQVSLFQTQVPGFYQRLGAVVVGNRFVNSRSHTPDASPWRWA